MGQAARGANPRNFTREMSQPKKFRIYIFSTDDNPLCTLTYNTGYLFVSIFSTCPGRPQPQAEYLGSLIFSIMKTQRAHGHATLTLYMSLIFLLTRGPQLQAENLGSLIFSLMRTHGAHGHTTLSFYSL